MSTPRLNPTRLIYVAAVVVAAVNLTAIRMARRDRLLAACRDTTRLGFPVGPGSIG